MRVRSRSRLSPSWSATIGAEFATVFNNAMMPGLVEDHSSGGCRAPAGAVGYIGGLVSLVLMLGLMVGDPETGKTLFGVAPIFGLDPATYEGDRASGPYSALWYVVFVLPMFLFTPDMPRRMPLGRRDCKGLANSKRRCETCADHANTLRFLLANMIYKDGAGGAVRLRRHLCRRHIRLDHDRAWRVRHPDHRRRHHRRARRRAPRRPDRAEEGDPRLAGGAGLSPASASCRSIATTSPSSFRSRRPADGGLFAGAGEKVYLLFGALDRRGRRAVAGRQPNPDGAGQPPEKQITEFFGLFALSGKVTSFVGPMLVASLTAISGIQRVGISVLVVFFVAGMC